MGLVDESFAFLNIGYIIKFIQVECKPVIHWFCFCGPYFVPLTYIGQCICSSPDSLNLRNHVGFDLKIDNC